MPKSNVFHSQRTEQEWKGKGEPYCEHLKFYRDGNGYGPDEVDWYCGTCGVTKTGRDGPTPPPRGTRSD